MVATQEDSFRFGFSDRLDPTIALTHTASSGKALTGLRWIAWHALRCGLGTCDQPVPPAEWHRGPTSFVLKL